MRTKTLLIGSASALLIAATILVSCQKKVDLKSTTTISDRQSATRVTNLQNLINTDDVSQAALVLSSYSEDLLTINCAPVITYDNPPGVYPRTVTADFGAVNCYQPVTGLTRRGKTITIYFGDMADTTSLSYYLQQYENYYVNDVKIEGQVKMAHNSRNNDPQNVFRQTYTNRKATEPNGDYTIWNGYRRLVHLEDNGEYPGPLTNTGYFRMTGVNTGDDLAGGVSYQWRDSIDEATPVIYNHCQFPVKGIRIIDFTNQPSWILDYGLNICDDQAELTISGITTTVTLPISR